MIRVVYRWNVPVENQDAFIAAWERTTVAIRHATPGARGSFCLANVDNPCEILTIATWDELHQWQDFVANAKLTSMKEMHALGTQTSHEAYLQKGDFTV